MKTYVLFYHKLADLKVPTNREEGIANRERLKAHHERIHKEIQAAGVLSGITVHSQQLMMGTACISGSDEAIQKLKTFVEVNGLGGVCDNITLQAIL